MDGRKLRYSMLMLAALIAFGTIGYYISERMSIFDALFIAFIGALKLKFTLDICLFIQSIDPLNRYQRVRM